MLSASQNLNSTHRFGLVSVCVPSPFPSVQIPSRRSVPKNRRLSHHNCAVQQPLAGRDSYVDRGPMAWRSRLYQQRIAYLERFWHVSLCLEGQGEITDLMIEVKGKHGHSADLGWWQDLEKCGGMISWTIYDKWSSSHSSHTQNYHQSYKHIELIDHILYGLDDWVKWNGKLKGYLEMLNLYSTSTATTYLH